jgi:hypothetical protein
VNLFRANKTSTRAKKYRSRRYTSAAYDVKNWSLGNLCQILREHGASRGITWGWKTDPKTVNFEWVLYVDLPQGQVSFHSASRGDGPDCPGDWDGKQLSTWRILEFCDNVLNAKPQPLMVPPKEIPPEVFGYVAAVAAAIETVTGAERASTAASEPFAEVWDDRPLPMTVEELTPQERRSLQGTLFPDVRNGQKGGPCNG